MRYHHTQVGWVILGAIAFADTISVIAVVTAGVPWLTIPVLGGTAVIFALFGWLRSEVDTTHLRIRFGIGIIRRNWALTAVTRTEVVRNPIWIGWGIRFMPRRTVFNVSGLSAVEFETAEGKIYRIGTNDPHGLHRAIANGARIS